MTLRPFLRRFGVDALPEGAELGVLMGTFNFIVHGYDDDPQEVYAIEEVRAYFPVDDEHKRAGLRIGYQRLRQRDAKALAIDPGDVVADFLNQQPSAIVLLLRPPVGMLDELRDLVLIDRVEQLREDARGLLLPVGVLVGRSVLTGRVALGGLLRDELVVDFLRLFVGHGGGCFNAGLQRGAAATVGLGDDQSVDLGFDSGLVDLVAAALAVIERGLLHRGSPFLVVG